MNEHTYYSLRKGTNKNKDGFELNEFLNLFYRFYNDLKDKGFFDQAFGFECVDEGFIKGTIGDIELEIILTIRKHNLYPFYEHTIMSYTEEDLFDIIEFLYQFVSKPLEGTPHNWENCGMHWETFSKKEGQSEFINRINTLLALYKGNYELSSNGQILKKPEEGFESIFEADIPTKDVSIKSKLTSAMNQYRRHSSTWDDRRQAIRELVDILEFLRPKVKKILDKRDDADLFNIANNFGIRHHNKQQKDNYDPIWLTWMFYFYLSTIHTMLRIIENK